MVSFGQAVLGIWMYVVALFWANPLNDATRPDSPMNPYSPGNISANEAAEITLGRIFEGEETRDDVIGGYDLWPILFTATVAVVSAIASAIGQQLLPVIPFSVGKTGTEAIYAALVAIPVLGWIVAIRTK